MIEVEWGGVYDRCTVVTGKGYPQQQGLFYVGCPGYSEPFEFRPADGGWRFVEPKQAENTSDEPHAKKMCLHREGV